MMKAERQELILKRVADSGRVVVTVFFNETAAPEIYTTPLTQYNGALGAALFAYQKALKNK